MNETEQQFLHKISTPLAALSLICEMIEEDFQEGKPLSKETLIKKQIDQMKKAISTLSTAVNHRKSLAGEVAPSQK